MNLGLPEMLMIFGVALLFFGPKKLPELGRSLGRGIVEFRNASREIRENFVHQLSVADEPDGATEAAPPPSNRSTETATPAGT